MSASATKRVASGINGAIDRRDVRWGADQLTVDHPQRYLYVYDADEQIDGYVVYDQHQTRQQWGFRHHRPRARRHRRRRRRDAGSVTSDRTWRRSTITVLALPPEVLLLLLPEQVVELVGANHWMTRVVDRRGAVAAQLPGRGRAECTFFSRTGRRRGTTAASCCASKVARESSAPAARATCTSQSTRWRRSTRGGRRLACNGGRARARRPA